MLIEPKWELFDYATSCVITYNKYLEGCTNFNKAKVECNKFSGMLL